MIEKNRTAAFKRYFTALCSICQDLTKKERESSKKILRRFKKIQKDSKKSKKQCENDVDTTIKQGKKWLTYTI